MSVINPAASELGRRLSGALERDGVAIARAVFAPRWIECLRQGLERELSEPAPSFIDFVAPGSTGRSLSNLCTWRRVPEFRRFLFESPVAAFVQSCLGVDSLRLVEDQWFVKEPGAVDPTAWHQDQPFYDVDLPLFSVWMPLDPVPREDALLFVRGSHRAGRQYLPSGYFAQLVESGENPDGYEPAPEHPEGSEVIGWEMEPGDCVIFSGLTLHGGGGNSGGLGPIRRFSSRWVPGGARVLRRERAWSGLPFKALSAALRHGAPLEAECFPMFTAEEARDDG